MMSLDEALTFVETLCWMLFTRKLKPWSTLKLKSATDCIASPFSSLLGSERSWHGMAWRWLVKRNAVQSQRHRQDTASVAQQQETCHSNFDSSLHIHGSPGLLLSSIIYSAAHWACSECTQLLKGILLLIQECFRCVAHCVDEELSCKLASVWPAPQPGGE